MVDNRGKQAGALALVGRDLRAPRAAGVAGLAFAVLFIAALLLVRSLVILFTARTPDSGRPDSLQSSAGH
jgi:hypothetical protein